MKTVEEYRRECRVLLGDPQGRRYSDDMVDMGIREALEIYGDYCPRKETIRMKVSGKDGFQLTLAGMLDPGTEILTARADGSPVWLNFAEYRADQKVYLMCYGAQQLPDPGDQLLLEIRIPHMIKDLSGAQYTTIPDRHSLTVCTGATASAMQIRARSVTEVFGKRPEDREALTAQAEALETEFRSRLNEIQSAAVDPLPRGGFPI